jgi:hypothetical protein
MHKALLACLFLTLSAGSVYSAAPRSWRPASAAKYASKFGYCIPCRGPCKYWARPDNGARLNPGGFNGQGMQEFEVPVTSGAFPGLSGATKEVLVKQFQEATSLEEKRAILMEIYNRGAGKVLAEDSRTIEEAAQRAVNERGEKNRRACAQLYLDWTGQTDVLPLSPPDTRDKAVEFFFSSFIGTPDAPVQDLARALVKFGKTNSRQFCEDFLAQQKPPRAPAAVDASMREKLLNFAEERCISWPEQLWGGDSRLTADADKVRLYPGRIIMKQMAGFQKLRASFPRAHILLQNSKDPARGLASLSVVADRMRMLFDAPRMNDHAKSQYETLDNLPLNWPHQAAYFETQLKGLGATALLDMRAAQKTSVTLADLVREAIRLKPSDEMLVITTHCDRKGRLRFSDGSYLPVSEVRQGEPLDAPIILLTCDTLTHYGDNEEMIFATGRSITYEEVISTIEVLWEATGHRPVGEAFQTLQMKELERRTVFPGPSTPKADQISIQLVEVTAPGTLTIHSGNSGIALIHHPSGVEILLIASLKL